MKEDRRQHPRKHLICVAEYKGSEGVNCIEVKNISIGGMGLEISGYEQPGNHIELCLKIGDGNDMMNLYGLVIWSNKSDTFEIGVHFLDLSTDQIAKLKENLE